MKLTGSILECKAYCIKSAKDEEIQHLLGEVDEKENSLWLPYIIDLKHTFAIKIDVSEDDCNLKSVLYLTCGSTVVVDVNFKELAPVWVKIKNGGKG